MRGVLLALVLLVPGCITFYGEERIEATVLITEDVGTTVLTEETVQLAEGSTALDAVRQVATVETSYGGGFVDSIDGRQSRYPDERIDWFYHVNTTLMDVGSASYQLQDGDVVLWDHRPWNRSMAVGHVLTGLATWPTDLAGSDPISPETLAGMDGEDRRYVRVQGDRLAVLDAWGVTARWVDPPWLLVHAAGPPGGSLSSLVVASGPNATGFSERLDQTAPTGAGVVLTDEATYEVPAS